MDALTLETLAPRLRLDLELDCTAPEWQLYLAPDGTHVAFHPVAGRAGLLPPGSDHPLWTDAASAEDALARLASGTLKDWS